MGARTDLMATSTSRLADRLRALRDRCFVGRASELELFRAALLGDVRPFAVLYVYGPGGVGKTVLLREFGRAAEATGAAVVALDGRTIELSPAGFFRGLRLALDLGEQQSPLDALARQDRPVLLIDTYEGLAPLDAWLREEFLPQLPADALVVIAGRSPPASAWRADPAWSELTHIVPLRNLEPRDSRDYLRVRGVPDAEHSTVLEFTHGHPLALSLLADLLLHGQQQRPNAFHPRQATDVVRALLERFVDIVPSRLHWQALAICAHARVTTEALLVEILGPAEASGLFTWLRDLPFVEEGPDGIFPHDLAREVLDADLRWRDPPTYRDLHARVRDSIVRRIPAGPGLTQQSAYFDCMYLVRHSPHSRPFYDWTNFGQLYAEVAAPEDHTSILEMVRRHEGEESARVAAYWLVRQPQAFIAFRGSGERVAGFAGILLLDQIDAADTRADPAISAAWAFAARHSPLRPGERIIHHRFFVGREHYQDHATHNMVAMVATMLWLTTPRLAWCFAAVADPEHWRPMFEGIRFPRMAEADFVVGGRHYGTFVHDWRTDPPLTWLETKTGLGAPAESVNDRVTEQRGEPLVVLSEPDFEAAVRHALRDYHRPELASSPLLLSRLAYEHADGRPTASTLQTLLRGALEELRGHPKEEKLYRVLTCTYFDPAPTQELAAEQLGLPFNTYRYQLAAAIRRMSGILWQREIQSTIAS